jgi:hypothetical protein
MKSRAGRIIWLGSAAIALALVGCLESARKNATGESQNDSEAAAQLVENQMDDSEEVMPETPPDTTLTDADFRTLDMGRVVPADLKVSAPLAELLSLLNSGIEESVMLAFVSNSTNPFEIGANEIIYLRDIGVPGTVVSALLERDEQLKMEAQVVERTLTQASTDKNPPRVLEPASPVLMPISGGGLDLTEDVPAQPDDVGNDYSGFNDALAPYGNWLDLQGFGRCWQPRVAVGAPAWQPYFDGGQWVYTEAGWYWKSDYSWGWAAFHYGRWFQHQRLGWCWKPDQVWGPAWVSWRYANEHCGWAPLPPAAHFSRNHGLTFQGRPASADCDFGLRAMSYRFIPIRHLADHHLTRFEVSRSELGSIFHATRGNTIITASSGRVRNLGIAPAIVASASRTPIHPVTLRETSIPVGRATVDQFEHGRGTLAIFRPGSTVVQVRPLPVIHNVVSATRPVAVQAGATAVEVHSEHPLQNGAAMENFGHREQPGLGGPVPTAPQRPARGSRVSTEVSSAPGLLDHGASGGARHHGEANVSRRGFRPQQQSSIWNQPGVIVSSPQEELSALPVEAHARRFGAPVIPENATAGFSVHGGPEMSVRTVARPPEPEPLVPHYPSPDRTASGHENHTRVEAIPPIPARPTSDSSTRSSSGNSSSTSQDRSSSRSGR